MLARAMRGGGAAGMAMLLAGCIFQPEPRLVQGEPYPAPEAKTHVEQRFIGAPKVETAPSANAVDVTITQSAECRDRTPMVRDVTTERKANTAEQWVNGGGAVLGLGLGALLLANDCSIKPDATPSDPNPASRPCTGDEARTQNIAGGVLLGSGALFAAAFVYNIIKARDSKETVPVRVDRDWGTCGMRPMASSPVRLVFGDGQHVEQITDAAGRARFDLSTIRWTDAALSSGKANVTNASGQELASFDLAALPQYISWSRDRGQRQAVAEGQANAQVERFQIDDCIGKLDAILSSYERNKNPSADETMRVVPSFNSTLNQQCGMREQVRADPRFAGLTRRLSPIAEKADDTAWVKARDACMKAVMLPQCSEALDFAKNNASRHKKDAEQLAQTAHVQRLAQRWAAAEQAAQQKRQEQCDRCMAVCRGNGTDSWDCQTKNCREFCL